MDTINLNYYEQRALLEYLKAHLSLDKPDLFDAANEHYLLTAYNKLQLAIDKRNLEIACAD